MRITRLFAVLLLLPGLAGCPPRTASVLVRDCGEAPAEWVQHDGSGYSVVDVYTVSELGEMLDRRAEEIARVEVRLTSGRTVAGDRAVVAADAIDVLVVFDGTETSRVDLDRVARIVLDEEIPASVRRDQFLVQAVLWPTIIAAGQLISDDGFDWGAVAVGAGVGFAFGTPFLLTGHREMEKVLVTVETP